MDQHKDQHKDQHMSINLHLNYFLFLHSSNAFQALIDKSNYFDH